MILSHKKINFRDSCLIEKVQVKAPFRFELDFPNDACFVHFLEGNTVVNAPYARVHVSSKDSVLLKCGRYFSDLITHDSTQTYEVLVIHLSVGMLKDVYRYNLPKLGRGGKPPIFIQKIEGQQLISEFIKGLQFYFDHPQLINDDLLELKVKELILLLLQTGSSSSVQMLFQQLFTPMLVNLMEVVNTHVYTDLSIADLAYLSNLSESTFKRRFKESYNDTPSSYIKKMRLARAKELLAVGSGSVTEIAFMVGFKDVAHFSRSFKTAFGISPTDYKERV